MKEKSFDSRWRKLAKEYALLGETEGWGKLTLRQKAIVLASLNLQKSVDSGQENTVYRDMYEEVYCYLAINSLETEYIPQGRAVRQNDPLNEDELDSQVDAAFNSNLLHLGFRQASWKTVDDDDPHKRNREILQTLEEVSVPSVLYLAMELKIFNDHDPFHTLLFLGRTEKGIPLIWQKSNSGEPFELRSLTSVLDDYPLCFSFSVRPLENRESLLEKGWISA